MRIFPAPHDGLHPAFPDFFPVLPSHISLLLASLPSAAYLIPFMGSGNPSTWATAGKTTAYGFFVSTACGIWLERHRRQRAEAFLHEENIEIPKAHWFTRVGYFDMDDAILLGSAIGIATASSLRRPRAVAGWRRGIAALSIGAGGGACLFSAKDWIQRFFSPEKWADFKRLAAQAQESAKWQGQVDQAWRRAHNRNGNPVGAGSLVIAPWSSPPSDLGNAGIPPSPPPRTPISPSEKIGHEIQSWPNLSNEPHLTATLPDKPNAEPTP